jgi:hypothetical protein
MVSAIQATQKASHITYLMFCPLWALDTEMQWKSFSLKELSWVPVLG